MANNRITFPLFKAWTASGGFASGYLLYTYEAGTSTPLTVYSDAEQTVAHANPIVLNAQGEAEIYTDDPVKLTLTDADGTVQTGFPVDDIDPTTVDADDVSVSPPAGYTATDVQALLIAMASAITNVSATIEWQVISSDTTAVDGAGYLVDTSAAVVTLTLPATPGEGDKVYLCDIAGSFAEYNLTVARNGLKIMALEEDLTVAVNRVSMGLVYSNSTYGWVIIA